MTRGQHGAERAAPLLGGWRAWGGADPGSVTIALPRCLRPARPAMRCCARGLSHARGGGQGGGGCGVRGQQGAGRAAGLLEGRRARGGRRRQRARGARGGGRRRRGRAARLSGREGREWARIKRREVRSLTVQGARLLLGTARDERASHRALDALVCTEVQTSRQDVILHGWLLSWLRAVQHACSAYTIKCGMRATWRLHACRQARPLH